jgi:aspartate aminotransferase
MINSPSNPTGAAYSSEELKAIAHVCVQAGIFIISDEIYDKITYDGFVQTSMISLGPDVVEKTILVNGASKAFAMTGWRMGFAAGPTEIIAAMSKLQGQSTSNISSITQGACVEAFTATPTFLKDWVAEYQKRRNFIVDSLNQIPGISCYKPQGAFYVFPNVTKILGRKTPKGIELKTSADFCAYLLADHLVACVPGHAFGAEGYLRISYATSMKVIEDGMKRIAKAVTMLT